MARTISFVNQKGGTGKSTACMNIASNLASNDYKTLLIDLDPQANATLSLGIELSGVKRSMYNVLIEETALSEVVREGIKGLRIAPSSEELANTDISLEGYQTRLKKVLEGDDKDRFDYILIDCPPALNLLTINALVASHEVIIPILCDYLSMEGLKQLLRSIERIRSEFNSRLGILGILPNMVDHRRNLTEEVLGLIRKEFKGLVFKTEIPVCVALAEAPSFGKDIFSYASWCTGATAYEEVVREILRRLGVEQRNR